MAPELQEFAPLLPEIFLLSMACFILVLDAFVGARTSKPAYLLTQATLIITALLALNVSDETQVVLGGTFVSDPMSGLLKAAVLIISFVVFLYSRDYLRDRDMLKGEYWVLGLTGVLGMMVMVSAHSMLTVYLGLELLSLSSYTLVAFQRNNGVASEAAMKYFVLGAIASGMLLYGMSMIYGATGSLDLAAISAAISARGVGDMALAMGVVFIVSGLAFKLGVAPFHMWVPDIYHGAPTAVTMYLGSAPKIAAFAMAIRLLVNGMEGMHADWTLMLMVLAIASMALGNIIAIAQSNVKRMLAYSTIAHMGFVVLGILAASNEGYSAAMFYALTYAIMSVGGFGVLIILSRSGFECETLDDLKGLNDRSPWLAFMMMLVVFSMAGVPPTVGFYSKLFVLQAVVSADLVWLAAVAVFFSIIGAFYYLRIVKLMYFDRPEDTTEITAATDTRIAISINGLSVLALGIYPAGLMALCIQALS